MHARSRPDFRSASFERSRSAPTTELLRGGGDSRRIRVERPNSSTWLGDFAGLDPQSRSRDAALPSIHGSRQGFSDRGRGTKVSRPGRDKLRSNRWPRNWPRVVGKRGFVAPPRSSRLSRNVVLPELLRPTIRLMRRNPLASSDSIPRKFLIEILEYMARSLIPGGCGLPADLRSIHPTRTPASRPSVVRDAKVATDFERIS